MAGGPVSITGLLPQEARELWPTFSRDLSPRPSPFCITNTWKELPAGFFPEKNAFRSDRTRTLEKLTFFERCAGAAQRQRIFSPFCSHLRCSQRKLTRFSPTAPLARTAQKCTQTYTMTCARKRRATGVAVAAAAGAAYAHEQLPQARTRPLLSAHVSKQRIGCAWAL